MCRKVSRNVHVSFHGAARVVEQEDDASSVCSSAAEYHHEHPRAGGVNPVWRAKVTQWCYDYMDCIQERRNLVYIAMNLLDRYIGLFDRPSVDQTAYRVAALSCTYLAIRIAGSKSLDLDDLVVMSRGTTTIREIVRVGTDIVDRLSWDERMETPTEHIHRYGQLLGMNDITRLEKAVFMVEVAVFHPSMLLQCPKLVAASALLRLLSPSCVPKLVRLLEDDDVKSVYDISHQLGVFCRECVGSTALEVEPPTEETTVHIIMDEDKIVQERVRPAVVVTNGLVLIPNDDDYMDEN